MEYCTELGEMSLQDSVDYALPYADTAGDNVYMDVDSKKPKTGKVGCPIGTRETGVGLRNSPASSGGLTAALLCLFTSGG